MTTEDHNVDWSQVNETVTMLDLAVTQLGWTLRDGDQSVVTLTQSFASMVKTVEEIVAVAATIPDGESKQLILNHGQSILQRVHEAIVAFQFYDKLSQRLNHAADSLTEMRHLVNDPTRLYEPNEWQALQGHIRARYTTEADKLMFDSVLQGASLEEAIAIYQGKMEQDCQDSAIQFF